MVRYGENFFTSLDSNRFRPPSGNAPSLCIRAIAKWSATLRAWDIDFGRSLSVKMCIDVTADYFTTVHHELGHNFYQRAYNQQPFLSVTAPMTGSMKPSVIRSPSLSRPAYLKTLGLAGEEPPVEADIPLQFRTALDKVAFLPSGLRSTSGAGRCFPAKSSLPTTTRPGGNYARSTRAWPLPWNAAKPTSIPAPKTISPPTSPMLAISWLASTSSSSSRRCPMPAGTRGGSTGAASTDPRPPAKSSQKMFEAGQSQPWQQTLKEMTGADHLDAQPMLDYFAPLYAWLKEQNKATAAH